MFLQKLLNDIIENKERAFCLGLFFLFFFVTIIHAVLIIAGKNIESMWMLFGTLAIMLVLVNAKNNIAMLLIIIVLGTFVADEEFLLEVAAIVEGEAIDRVRESRKFELLTIGSEEETMSQLSRKLEILLQSNASPEQIIRELEDCRIEMEIQQDLPGFKSVDKDVIYTFATHGVLEESFFFNLMEKKGYSVSEISGSFKKLGAAEYLSHVNGDKNRARLTRMGVSLATTLGLASSEIVSTVQ